jgi:hypothetical protein
MIRLTIRVSGMHGVRFKGLEDCVQTRREVILLQVIVLARRADAAYQASNLPELFVHSAPLFLV